MAVDIRRVEHDCCPRCTSLARNARTLADLMAMRDWTVMVKHEPPIDDRAVMTVELAADQKRLRLRASDAFWEMPEQEKRRNLTHELVHPLLRDLYETVRQGVEGELSGSAFRMFMGQVATEKERAVDVIATVLAEHLPDLEW